MAASRLTASQQAFLDAFLQNGGNASRAYRSAYPSCKSNNKASAGGARLKKHPLIQKALAEANSVTLAVVDNVLERYAISQDRLADAMARLAFTELRQVVDVQSEMVQRDGKSVRVQQVVLRDFKEIDDNAHQAITEVKRSASGEVSVKLADKRAAIMDLARLKGWIVDKPIDSRQLVMLKIER